MNLILLKLYFTKILGMVNFNIDESSLTLLIKFKVFIVFLTSKILPKKRVFFS